jgi:hypothetical protein
MSIIPLYRIKNPLEALEGIVKTANKGTGNNKK